MGGDNRSRIKGENAEWVLALVKREPDLTLVEIRARLVQDRSLSVGHDTIWRFLDRRDIGFPYTPASRTGLMLPRHGLPGGSVSPA